MELPLGSVPAADPAAEPEGFVVLVDEGDRIHFLDWGGPTGSTGAFLIHGLSQTAWLWTPVARRLRGAARTVAMDLRGHGLSDAPTDDPASTTACRRWPVTPSRSPKGRGCWPNPTTGSCSRATASGRSWRRRPPPPLDPAAPACVLVDGGWEDLEQASEMDVEEFLRGLDEPPEVLASMRAFLADRAGFDPSTWDADQQRAARATVVETHAGRVVPATRPHALEACVRTMFAYDPLAVLPEVEAPITALIAADDEAGSRAAALTDVSAARVAAGRGPIAVRAFPHVGHNLMRYRPAEVTAAILGFGATGGR